jgi:hypothetical protein
MKIMVLRAGYNFESSSIDRLNDTSACGRILVIFPHADGNHVRDEQSNMHSEPINQNKK